MSNANETYVETPFNMMIVGMTNCGKTYYLLEMIEKEYFRHFEYIFLICPTYKRNKTYQEWIYKDSERFYPIPSDEDSVDDFIRYIVDSFDDANSLIILDDCAATLAVKNRVSRLVKLGMHGRHYGFSSIVITQQYTSIAKPYRENIAKLVLLYSPDKEDIQTITNKYLRAEKEETKDIIQKLGDNTHARLEMRLRCPYVHKLIISNK